MSKTHIEAEALTKAALALFDEAYVGPSNPSGTWFIDNEPKSGFLGTLEAIDARRASEPLTAGDPLSLASHVNHLRFALNLANRAARGEHPYANADWKGSWSVHGVDAATWSELVANLRSECDSFRRTLSSGEAWKDEEFMTGTLGLIAHGAWHLGAIRQGLGLVRAPH